MVVLDVEVVVLDVEVVVLDVEVDVKVVVLDVEEVGHLPHDSRQWSTIHLLLVHSEMSFAVSW